MVFAVLSGTAALHLDANACHRQTFGLQLHLQAGHELAQLGGHSVGADEQTPMPIFDRPGLHAGAQRGGQQWANHRQALAGSLHTVNQACEGG